MASLLKVRAADRQASLFLGVDGKQAGVELAAPLRLLIPPGQPPQKEIQGVLRLDAQHGVDGAGHPQVGDEAGAAGEHPAVRRGNVGVGAPDRRRPAVQVPAHGPLFAGGLGMEIHQHQVKAPTAPVEIGGFKGAVQVGVQVHTAHDVQHRQPQALALVDAKAPPGHPAGVVGGTEDAVLLVQEGPDLNAVPGVVAQGDNIRPGLQHPPGLGGGDADSGGVFPVYHGEMRPGLLPQFGQTAGQNVLSALAHYIADG